MKNRIIIQEYEFLKLSNVFQNWLSVNFMLLDLAVWATFIFWLNGLISLIISLKTSFSFVLEFCLWWWMVLLLLAVVMVTQSWICCRATRRGKHRRFIQFGLWLNSRYDLYSLFGHWWYSFGMKLKSALGVDL